MFSPLGQAVKMGQLDQSLGLQAIDITQLPSGFYLLEITSGKEVIQSKKIMILRD
jgi:hypothetical protein